MADEGITRLFGADKAHELPTSAKAASAIGATRYFTGKPCKYGHVAPRWTASFGCVECLKTYRKECPEVAGAWLEKNRDKAREANRRSMRKHKERAYKCSAEWRKRNPEAVRDANARRNNNPYLKEKSRQYREANKEKRSASSDTC